jgi:hypothetical protein
MLHHQNVLSRAQRITVVILSALTHLHLMGRTNIRLCRLRTEACIEGPHLP